MIHRGSIALFDADYRTVLEIAENLRPEDRRELETATGHSAVEAVFRSLASSEWAYVSRYKGEPHAVFGVTSGGVIWMVGTKAIEKSPIATLKLAREFIAGLLEHHYQILWNQVDARNTLHIRWLESLGFSFGAHPKFKNGMPFIPFYKERKNV